MKRIYDVFEEKARKGDAGFAIAFAILEHAEAISGLRSTIARLEMNEGLVGENGLHDIASAIEEIARVLDNKDYGETDELDDSDYEPEAKKEKATA